MIIARERVRGNRRIAVVDPSSGEPIGEIPAGSADDVDASSRAAAAAADGWASGTGKNSIRSSQPVRVDGRSRAGRRWLRIRSIARGVAIYRRFIGIA
jgi:hypothetical protein